jgi:2'-5' RNA ligase
MMGLIAIDIALIPNKEIIDLCVELTKDTEKPLGTDDFLPHVSLFLGCVEEENVPKIIDIVKQYEAVDITISELRLSKRTQSYHLDIEETPELVSLHKEILAKVRLFHVPEASPKELIDGNKTGISETSKDILNHYAERETYWPHITLRLPEKAYINLPITSSTTIELYQVGDGCQCRRKLS